MSSSSEEEDIDVPEELSDLDEQSDQDEQSGQEEDESDQEEQEEDQSGQDEDGDEDEEEDDDDDDKPKPTAESKEKRKEQREKRKFDFERNERTIFVGNLPSKMDHRDVEKLFKPCGPIESARIRSIVPEKEKLPPKVALITQRIHPKVDSVNAYVVFAKAENDDCIKKALDMNGKVIDGHHIRVDRAQHPNSKRMTLTSRKKSVFVGNLRFDLRDDDLIAHFAKAGEVDYVRLVRDRGTGLGKGFGFVKFMERAAVKKALEMNDSDFKGRPLRVKKVDDKMKMDDDKGPSKQKADFGGANKGQPQKQVQNKFNGGNRQHGSDKPRDQHRNSGGRPQRNFDRPQQKSFDRPPRKSFDRPQQKNFDRPPRKSFDGPQRKSFDGPQRKSFDRPQRKSFDGPPKGNQKFNKPNQDGKPDKKRVKFDLKKSTSNTEKQEAHKFDKSKIMKKDKKKTILKKKLKKAIKS